MFFLFINTVLGQGWAQTAGRFIDDFGFSIHQTTDGGYSMTGYTIFFGNGMTTNIWLIKTDSMGNQKWNQTFTDSMTANNQDSSVYQATGGGYIITGETFTDSMTADDQDSYIHYTTDGGYIITGYTYSFGTEHPDVLLIKIDSSGDEEWWNSFGETNESNFGNSVQQTTDGGYIITGHTISFEEGIGQNVLLIKTDSQGNKVWDQTFGGNDIDLGNSVQQTIDGGYIITGHTLSFGNGEEDVWLIKTDSQGQEEWNQTFGGNDIDLGNSVQQTIDGGYIITGSTYSFENYYGNVYLIKTDSKGQEEWDQNYGGNNSEKSYSVQQTTDGGYIVTGSTYSYGNGEEDVWLIKTDSQGNEKWNQTFGGSSYDKGYSVQQTTDGGYIITGYTSSFGNGENDVLLIKTDSEGNTVPYGD